MLQRLKFCSACFLLLAILCLSCVTAYAQTQSISEAGTRATLAHPASVTNVVYSSRAISSDGKLLRSTRYWLSGTQIRLVSEEITNDLSATSLQAIPESVWTKGRMTLEVIRNERGTFVRRQRPSDWDEVVEHAKRDFASKVKQGEFHVFDPEVWQETSDADSLLSGYPLTIDADENARNSLSTPGMVKERGRLAYYRDEQKHALDWEVMFDPATGLKTAERRWTGDQLVFEARWDTAAAIASSQFEIQDRDLEPWRRRFGEKSAGIGLILKPDEITGPFTIAGVLSNSPAATARIEPGALLVAIEGRSTQGMQRDAAVDLIRGLPGTRIKIDVLNAQTQVRKTLELERRILRPSPGIGQHSKN